MTRNQVKGGMIAAAGIIAAAAFAVPALAATGGQVSGQGALETDPRRNFSVSAKINADGTASGRATLVNKAFTGANGKAPYLLQVDISCGKMLDEPGAGKDKVSRAYFWDDDPNTQGPPSACVNSTLADVPLETIVSGNINVKD